jgi:spermidine/putrescine transport system substrate-binding protein
MTASAARESAANQGGPYSATPDPEVQLPSAPASLSPAVQRRLVSRRGLLLGGGLATLLTACDWGRSSPQPDVSAADMSSVEKAVNWSNWPDYIDPGSDLGDYPTLQEFSAQTGIRVNYTTDYYDNELFVVPAMQALKRGQQLARDVWCSSDWIVARLIREGCLLPLRTENIPNSENLQPSLEQAPFDPGRQYSLPWQSGFTGIGYNPKAAGGIVESVEQLFTDEQLKGKVTLLTDVGDTVGLTMLSMGIDPATFTAAQFTQAIGRLTDVKASGQLKGFTGNEYISGLASGQIAACFAYSGDMVQLQAENPDLGFTLPSAGHIIWSDNFVIPRYARHRTNAETLINFYYDPKVMAQVEDWVNYISPVVGSREALLKSDPAVAKNELIFPSSAILARSHPFRGFTAEEDQTLNAAFNKLIQ